MAVSDIVLTAEGRQKLIDELEWREGDLTKQIVERIKTARDFGDLSENSEYDDAKEEQAKNAARIAEIQSILANAKDAETVDHTLTVSIGCTVDLVDGDGVAMTVTLVGTTETNSLEHKISNESPVGRAIIGHGEGETVEVVTPSGKSRVYTITKISR
ncbi:GreA/GreB family elongation factor [Collinsella intestinalis]|uniref:GreA/GreB family elongation factor n=1 Tax=Collinsella intestinalis TaxID=147207 RepID=UPI00195EC9E9|nr:transcription elongation factor GreA [Collinsella intestinalis]MBM6943171.1 transcription elongation factor GreA [Collinsella intestinalis]MDM8163246.1 transcription elongation factor GreA [Collinsella intestinalis]HIU04136.1 transcription elongation factor GreA [Candidatus Coprousia avicola]